MTPDTIGRYQVFAQLGQGGFATVYRAYDPRLDRDVAVKVLHPALARDPLMRERFLHEARALASVRHQHLVRLFDAGEVDDLVYLAMEFIPGRSLEVTDLGGTLSTADVVRIIGQTAAALDTLHAAGLVHRDVKPANIMLADDGRAVLVDLGVARSLRTAAITSPSVVLGTPGFLAPEQLTDGGGIGPRTDVYQLAATTYTLLTGRPPFEGSPAEVLYAITHRPAPDVEALCPDVPPSIAAVIAEGLAKDPRRRPATAGAFAASLADGVLPPTLLMPRSQNTVGAAAAPPTMPPERGAGAVASAAPVQSQPPVPPASRPRRRFFFRVPFVAAVAGVALILLGGGAVAVSHAQSDGVDTPRVITQDADPRTSPTPPAHGGTSNRYRAAQPSAPAYGRPAPHP